MSCEYESVCANNDKCYRCVDQKLLKQKTKPWEKKKYNSISLVDRSDTKKMNSDKSWEDLEQKVADSLNNVPSIQNARRSIRSGALWFEKGDIVDEILHPECKERTGNQLKAGDQSISIHRRWLEKASDECKNTKKTMCLPFRFKGDSKIYTIFEHNDIAELITLMKSYIRDNELKTEQIRVLEEELKSLRKE